ncbi:hypothetical protein CPB84DRAFT_140863 [Gymnopilus junonius]|uniref:F-box domain-containing protein n=1 Tax=Gymnopilus junonius TaxID=109634 RepID=A0A9P5NGK4_GYMJU|nr:hypothetical protein CPB84DRAFT_140863 [Gymnopilus junonius]
MFRLNQDVLSLIFMVNTQLDNFSLGLSESYDTGIHPLTTTRHTSQVCQQWRRLLIGSPLIWANSIELGLLAQKRGRWRKEVLRRCGFTERIRILDVKLCNLDSNVSPFDLEEFMCRRAPMLEHIRIWVDPNNLQCPNIKYCSKQHTDFIFPLSTYGHLRSCPYLPQLHSISLDEFTLGSTSELSCLLKNMTMVECLTIYCMPLHMGGHLTRPINFLNLSQLRIKHNLAGCLVIMSRVMLHQDCALYIRCRVDVPEDILFNPKILAKFSANLNRASTSFFQNHSISSLTLVLFRSRFAILESSKKYCETALPDHSIDITSNHPHDLPSAIVPSLLHFIPSSYQLITITSVEFDIQMDDHLAARHCFRVFASACPNLEEICVSKAAAKVLHDFILDSTSMLFAKLNTVTICVAIYSIARITISSKKSDGPYHRKGSGVLRKMIAAPSARVGSTSLN